MTQPSATNVDTSAAHQFPLPKVLQRPGSTPPTLITQGAEGRLYKSTYLFPNIPCAVKYRPPKPWRHPVLDQRLTKHRILSEARILAKCRRDGINVPAVYAVDEAAGWLMLEWIDGAPVRVRVNERLGKRTDGIDEDEALKALMRKIGVAIASLHKNGIVHGDLTTSNMMLRPFRTESNQQQGSSNSTHKDREQGDPRQGTSLDGEIVIIDLGLATGSVQDEDRAVDLYVLERAFGSTHPRAECLFGELLEAYRPVFKQAPVVLRKLEDVRLRGRKRSMIG